MNSKALKIVQDDAPLLAAFLIVHCQEIPTDVGLYIFFLGTSVYTAQSPNNLYCCSDVGKTGLLLSSFYQKQGWNEARLNPPRK